MVTQALRKRRKDCSIVFFLVFVLGSVVVITLPGFLYFFFWEKAGWVISSLIGFLLGSFVLSVLEGVWELRRAVRRLMGRDAGGRKGRVREKAPVPGAGDE